MHPDWSLACRLARCAYAEESAKKIRNIVTSIFRRRVIPASGLPLRDVVLFWIGGGRWRNLPLDNPHTRPVVFLMADRGNHDPPSRLVFPPGPSLGPRM